MISPDNVNNWPCMRDRGSLVHHGGSLVHELALQSSAGVHNERSRHSVHCPVAQDGGEQVMRMDEFALERYFARWEFVASHLLCSSDVQGWRLDDLLALADDE